MAWDDDSPAVQSMESRLRDQFEALRTIATGTGTFANNTARDAAIRTIARLLMIFVRTRLGRGESAD